MKHLNGAVAVIAIVALLLAGYAVTKTGLVSNGSPAFGAAGNLLAENYIPYVMYNGGYNSAKDLTISGSSAFSGVATFASTVGITGLTTLDGGSLLSNTNSTSTLATAYTLVAADIQNYDTVMMVPNIGALTITFPATSSITTFLPTAGDSQRQCWYNATGTVAATIIFAAGTGWDFEVASSTAGTQGAVSTNLTIKAGNSGCFTFLRKPATATTFDIVAQFQAFTDAD